MEKVFTIRMTVEEDEDRIGDADLIDRVRDALGFSTARDALETALNATVTLQLTGEEVD